MRHFARGQMRDCWLWQFAERAGIHGRETAVTQLLRFKKEQCIVLSNSAGARIDAVAILGYGFDNDEFSSRFRAVGAVRGYGMHNDWNSPDS